MTAIVNDMEHLKFLSAQFSEWANKKTIMILWYKSMPMWQKDRYKIRRTKSTADCVKWSQ